ncbi:MAG: hypothetical protein D9V47_00070 [Clostridia bacterium]|nr:MAG: hypothetical protein D9V47_00070 [Clostridia bacterium]
MSNSLRQQALDQALRDMGIPRQRVIVDYAGISGKTYNALVEAIAEYEQKAKTAKKNPFQRRPEVPEIDLGKAVGEIKTTVEVEFKQDMHHLGRLDMTDEDISLLAEYQQKAVTDFLQFVARLAQDLDDQLKGNLLQQVWELAPELAPPPEPSKEVLKQVQALRKQAEEKARQVAEAADTISKLLQDLDGLWKQEANLLRGTSEEGQGKIRLVLEKTRHQLVQKGW